MNANYIFYGFTKDGKERCLLEKLIPISRFSKNYYVLYVDLNTQEAFKVDLVDINTLRPIKKLLDLKRSFVSKRKVVNFYKKDRMLNVDVRQLFYGDIIKFNSKNDDIKVDDYVDINNATEIKVENNVLFRGTSNGFCKKFTDGEDFRVINRNMSEVSIINSYVVYKSSIKNYRDKENSGCCNPILTKRKVLELDYRKEL